MALFTIDPKKCKRDCICAAVCPGNIITQPTQKDFPTPVAGAEEFCIDCGHCVASCPHDALTLNSMPFADCPVIDRDRLPDADSARLFLQARRSMRCYKSKTVPNRVLQDLIDTARFAPTG
ncbi:MAG: 4Fe-4S binding protein, partial [Smithellaceae bacterium]